MEFATKCVHAIGPRATLLQGLEQLRAAVEALDAKA